MSDSGSDSELELLDDLQGLQAELAALRAELGEDYVTYQGGDEDSEGEEGGPQGLPGAALASAAAASEPSQPSSERQQTEQGTEARWEGRRAGGPRGRRATAQPAAAEQSEEEEEEEEEESQRSERPAAAVGMEEEAEEEAEEQDDEEDEHEQAAQMIGRALAPSLRRSSRSTLHSQQTAQPPARGKQQEEQQQQAGKQSAEQQRQRGRGQAAAQTAQAAAGGRKARGKNGAAGEAAPAGRRSAGKAAAAAGAQARTRAPQAPVSKLEAVRAALEANRDLQARLHRLLASTNRAIDCNANVLLRVRALAAKKNAPPAVATVPLTSEAAQLQAPHGTSWFWGSAPAPAGGPVAGGIGGASSGLAVGGIAGGAELPPNPDAAELQPLYQRLPFSFRTSRWSEEEQQKLRDGVLQLVQELQLQDLMQEMQQRLESGGSVSRQEYEDNKQRLAALTLQSPVVAQLAASFRDEDWAMLVQRQRLQRTTTECRLQWANAMAPTLSQRPWTAEEDTLLRQLADKYQQRQWETVSRELAAATAASAAAAAAAAGGGAAAALANGGGHVRPPLACLQRYQQLLAGAGKEAPKMDSTTEGIARLAPLVAKHGSTWKRIAEEYNAQYGGGWDPDQLMHIWRRHAQRGPQARKGKWTEEEDEMLLRAMALHGRKWSHVAKLVPGRTDVQCRERYMNCLNPDVHAYKPWTRAEDELLLELCKQHTQPSGRIKWAAVAAGLEGRTDKHCTSRYRNLTSGESQEPKKRRKAGEAGAAGGTRKRSRPSKAAKAAAAEGGAGGEAVEEGQGAAAEGGEQRQQPPQQQQQQPEAAPGEALLPQQPRQQQQQQQQEQEQEGEQDEQSAVVGRRPKRQRQARRWLDEEQAAAAAQAAERAAAEFPEEPPPVLPAAPAATSAEMPLDRQAAVGQLVAVWHVTDEATGAGSMFPGRISAWHPRLRQHSVRYPEEHKPLKTRLEQETVEWREAGGVVTGPGAAWPGEEEEEEEEVAQGLEAGKQQQEAAAAGEQAQAAAAEEAAREGRRPARSRRPSTRMKDFE